MPIEPKAHLERLEANQLLCMQVEYYPDPEQHLQRRQEWQLEHMLVPVCTTELSAGLAIIWQLVWRQESMPDQRQQLMRP